MKLWGGAHHDKTVLILDIGSGSVGAALADIRNGAAPNIIASTRIRYRENTEKDLLKAVAESLSKMKGKAGVHEVLLSFSTPWLASELKETALSESAGFVLNSKRAKEIIDKEHKEFLARIKSPTEEYEVFEQSVAGIFLNGYETELPVSKTATNMDMNLLLSAASKNLIKSIEDEVIKIVGIRKGIRLESFMFAYMKVFSHAFQNTHSALLASIGDEAGEFLFIKGGAPIAHTTLMFGSTSVARRIEADLKIPLDVAKSYLSILGDGVLEPSVVKKLDASLAQIESEWKDAWAKALSNIQADTNFPFTLYLCSRHTFGKMFKALFEGTFLEREIVLIGNENKFTDEITSMAQGVERDERISILASFAAQSL